jgi:hypothetical protein
MKYVSGINKIFPKLAFESPSDIKMTLNNHLQFSCTFNDKPFIQAILNGTLMTPIILMLNWIFVSNIKPKTTSLMQLQCLNNTPKIMF